MYVCVRVYVCVCVCVCMCVTRPWQCGERGLYQGAGAAGIEAALVSCSLTPVPKEEKAEPGYLIYISLYPAPPVFDI